jgi:hypothetical protein
MSGPKRSADKLNTICSAVLVYVTIVALQAFYMDDTSEIQMMADYGGQDTTAKAIRAEQTGNITRSAPNAPPRNAAEVQTYRIPISVAMQKIVEEARNDASTLIPAYGPSKCRTVLPDFGRPKTEEKPPCPAWGQTEPAPAPTPAPVDVPLTPTGGTGPGGGPLPNRPPGTTNNPGTGTGSAVKGNDR